MYIHTIQAMNYSAIDLRTTEYFFGNPELLSLIAEIGMFDTRGLTSADNTQIRPVKTWDQDQAPQNSPFEAYQYPVPKTYVLDETFKYHNLKNMTFESAVICAKRPTVCLTLMWPVFLKERF